MLKIDSIEIREPEALFYSIFDGRYFEAPKSKVFKAIQEFEYERFCNPDRHYAINYLYEKIGIDVTPVGRDYGWSSYNKIGDIGLHYTMGIIEKYDRLVVGIDTYIKPTYVPELSGESDYWVDSL